MKKTYAAIGAFTVALCVPMGLPASAAQMWRCGSSYSDKPCTNGAQIELDDARDPARQREARDDTNEARKTADRLERDRLKQEAAQARARPVLIDNRPAGQALGEHPVTDRKSKRKGKGEKADTTFTAHDPVATARNKAAKAAARKSRKG